MPGSEHRLIDILAQYGPQFRSASIQQGVGASGFSGAIIARVECDAGHYCLRGWPESGMAPQRILGLHRLLASLHDRGIGQVAVPVSSRHGSTIVEVAGRVWQLEPWMPGKADFWQNSSEARLESAMHCLAYWHQAAADFVPTATESSWFATRRRSYSPAVSERLAEFRYWQEGNLTKVTSRIATEPESDFSRLATRFIQIFERVAVPIAQQLGLTRTISFGLQPCLRDIWHDHVLFTGDDVTGIIDPSACRTENVAADLSRLLGSLVGDDSTAWDVALSAYQKVRPLHHNESALVTILDQSGVILSGMTWLKRNYIQGRDCASSNMVVSRLRRILERAEHLQQTID